MVSCFANRIAMVVNIDLPNFGIAKHENITHIMFWSNVDWGVCSAAASMRAIWFCEFRNLFHETIVIITNQACRELSLASGERGPMVHFYDAGGLGALLGKTTQPNHYNYNRFMKEVPKLAEAHRSQQRSRAANTSANIAPEHYMCKVSSFCYSKIRQITIHYHGHANCKTRNHHIERLRYLI